MQKMFHVHITKSNYSKLFPKKSLNITHIVGIDVSQYSLGRQYHGNCVEYYRRLIIQYVFI